MIIFGENVSYYKGINTQTIHVFCKIYARKNIILLGKEPGEYYAKK